MKSKTLKGAHRGYEFPRWNLIKFTNLLTFPLMHKQFFFMSSKFSRFLKHREKLLCTKQCVPLPHSTFPIPFQNVSQLAAGHCGYHGNSFPRAFVISWCECTRCTLVNRGTKREWFCCTTPVLGESESWSISSFSTLTQQTKSCHPEIFVGVESVLRVQLVTFLGT